MFIDALVPIVGLFLIFTSAKRTTLIKNLSRSTKCVFIALIFLLMTFFAWKKMPITMLWLGIAAFAAILNAISAFESRRGRDLTMEEALSALDRVLLSVKSGRSLRSALREISEEKGPPATVKLWKSFRERFEHGGGFDSSQLLSGEILAELRLTEKRGTRATESLESLRSNLRLRLEFRRRSGQLTLQTRLQAFLASFLYLPLLCWQFFEGNFFRQRTLISFSLFLVSQIWIHWLSKRFQWKV